MASLFLFDDAEYEPMWTVAVGDSELEVSRRGPFVELRFPDAVTIDRRASGVRHAVWYSGVSGVLGARVVQFDKDQLRVVADGAAA